MEAHSIVCVWSEARSIEINLLSMDSIFFTLFWCDDVWQAAAHQHIVVVDKFLATFSSRVATWISILHSGDRVARLWRCNWGLRRNLDGEVNHKDRHKVKVDHNVEKSSYFIEEVVYFVGAVAIWPIDAQRFQIACDVVEHVRLLF